MGMLLWPRGFDRLRLAESPGDYGPPKGVLLIASVGWKVAGCVAAHEWRADTCEMKRLFARGLGAVDDGYFKNCRKLGA